MSAPSSTSTPFIGKYRVVQFIGAGGMAEVWLCRRSSIGGFEKPVVIKRILPTYAADPDFVRMFLDEARVAAGLNHPNIVQVYDIDVADEVPFIAMEYVQGPSFQALLSRARKAGGTVGLATALRVISDVAAGLHYAHNALDADGQPLGIVHRDISPHNILVSGDGVAKLLDFGVAKSRGRLTSTQAGTVKGKISHMAPEQARNEEIDHRADVYSLGVCLYEATTGRLPFLADQDVQRLLQIVNGDFPRPSSLVPEYPPRLEEIVLKAMSLDRNFRTPSAQVLHDELETLALELQTRTSHTSVAHRVSELFPQGDPGRVTRTGLTPWPAPSSPSSPRFAADAYRSPPRTLTGPERAALGERELPPPPVPDELGPADESNFEVDLGTNALPLLTGPGAVTVAPAPAPRRALWVAAIVAAVVLAVVGTLVATRSAGAVAASPVAAVVPVARVPDTRDVEVRAALEEAERLMEEHRYAAASGALTRARERPAVEPALNHRVATLLDAAEVASAVEHGRELLGAGDFEGALAQANAALAREPGNQDAERIGAEARTRKAARDAPPTPPPAVAAAAPIAAPPPPSAPPPPVKKVEPVPVQGFHADGLLPTDPDSILPPSAN